MTSDQGSLWQQQVPGHACSMADAGAEPAPLLRGTTFTFDYLAALLPLFFVLRLNAACSSIRVADGELAVRMGWAFSARVPLARVRAVAPDGGFVGGIGVHGFGSSWLVNGSHRNIVRVEVPDGAPARVCGVPLTLRVLRIGVAERDAFVAAVRAGSADE